jgi:hypothetical protein
LSPPSDDPLINWEESVPVYPVISPEVPSPAEFEWEISAELPLVSKLLPYVYTYRLSQ